MSKPYQRKPRNKTLPPGMLFRLEIAQRVFIAYRIDDDLSVPENERSLYVRTYPSLNAMDLSVMTGADLDALEKFWTSVIAHARPIVEHLDTEAQEALERGDHKFKRLYRPDPRLIDFTEPDKEKKDETSATDNAGEGRE